MISTTVADGGTNLDRNPDVRSTVERRKHFVGEDCMTKILIVEDEAGLRQGRARVEGLGRAACVFVPLTIAPAFLLAVRSLSSIIFRNRLEHETFALFVR